MFELIDVALGKEKAELVIKNGSLLNVYTGEILDGFSVAIKGEKIAYVGRDADHTIGAETRVIMAKNQVLIPGFIDAHAHMFAFCRVDEAVKYAIKGGTTTVITEVIDTFFHVGYPGLREFMEAAKIQPIKIFMLLPGSPFIGESPKKQQLTGEEADSLLKQSEVLGVGEIYWPYVLRKDENALMLIRGALARNKKVEGHGAGARDKNLAAYASAGVSSCHEAISAEEALERLNLGLTTMIREGSIRQDLEAAAAIKDKIHDFRKLCLVSDGLFPKDLLERGYMDYIVQKAIDLGFDPVKAIQMATINPAQHFSLDGILGGIAPGKYADILLVPSLSKIKPKLVISNGKIIAKNGKLLAQPKKPKFRMCMKPIKLKRKILPSDFQVYAEGTEAKVRIIKFVGELVTKETQATLPVIEGKIKCNPEKDILKVAVVDRCQQQERVFTGFVEGFGIKSGALASSVAWDTPNLIVIGANEKDMAKAVNRISIQGGGIILAENGKVLVELPLPIAGTMSDLPMKILAKKLEDMRLKLRERGCPLRDPHLSLITLTSPAIPFIRICEDGLIDVKTGKPLSLMI